MKGICYAIARKQYTRSNKEGLMKRQTLVCYLIFALCVFHFLIPHVVFGNEDSPAEKVFEKHKVTLQRTDVQNALNVFNTPEAQTRLTLANMNRVSADPEFLKELVPEIDDSFITLLKEDTEVQALFNDVDFQTLLQDPEALGELTGLSKAGWIELFIRKFPSLALFLIIAVTLYTLGKGADWLVDEAVMLSTRWGLGKAVIGATIVSIGTTTPEAAVSVLSAIQGKPGLALGNAVGSIICDTGLILGLASLIAPLPLNRELASRLSNVQVGAGILLVVGCFPWTSPAKVFMDGGTLHQLVGVVFVILLGLYIWQSIRWASATGANADSDETTAAEATGAVGTLMKLIGAIVIIVISAQILIPSVSIMAERIGVPQHIISATLVAFGTSLPELVTAITAVRRGHGELAVGNIIGADILNVLFVAGVSAAATSEGLKAEVQFFQFLFPAMLFILIVFRCGIFVSGDQLKRPFGVVLVATWILVTILSYVLSIEMH